jgi:hypothetical protein
MNSTLELSVTDVKGNHFLVRQNTRANGYTDKYSNSFTWLKPGNTSYFLAACAGNGASISSLRMTMLVALRLASSKPWPWVMASVGQASTQ